MDQVKVAILGASGYIGEELLRLLLRHPGAVITQVTSRTNAGQPVGDVFPRYRECALRFSAPDVDTIAATAKVAFLALPHGLAHEFAIPLLAKGVTVIDVSADFRLKSAAKYAQYYKGEHPAPALLAQAVYGAPERHRAAIKASSLIACPGCYPTSIALPLCPLLAAGLIEPTGLIAASMSGVSGAGRKADLPLLFSECNESLRPYNVVGHRHIPEIEQELAAAAGVPDLQITFTPHLVPVTRGIHSTLYARRSRADVTVAALHACLAAAYANEPFVRVLPPGELADTKHVTWTNMCEIGVALDARMGQVILSSAIDNLTRGGSGQAVQCFNIVCGFPETYGLQ